MLITQSCSTLCDPMDCSPPDSSVHGILQARILEWVAIPFSRGSSWPRDWTLVPHISGRFFTVWATREAHQWIKSESVKKDGFSEELSHWNRAFRKNSDSTSCSSWAVHTAGQGARRAHRGRSSPPPHPHTTQTKAALIEMCFGKASSNQGKHSHPSQEKHRCLFPDH